MPTRKDWAALAVLATGLGLIVLDGTIVSVALPVMIQDLGMDLTDAQWVNSLYAVVLAVSVVAIALFIAWERHRKKVNRSALLDLDLFGIASFSWGNVTAAMVAVGEFALLFVLPLYLVNVLGLDVIGAGLVLAAMAFGAFLSGATARHMAAKFGASGTVLIGLSLEVAGALALAILVSGSTPGWVVALPLAVYGLGLGLASAQLTGTVLSDVPVEVSGTASATQSTVRQVGSALGTAFSGAVLATALAKTLPDALAKIGMEPSASGPLSDATRQSAGTTIMQLRMQGVEGAFGEQTPAIVSALADGFADATRIAMLAASAFLSIGFLAAAKLRQNVTRE